jgi:hypothetical protein
MSLTFTMGDTGLSSLQYNGQEMLYAAGNCPYVVDMYGHGPFGTGGERQNQWLGNQPLQVSTTPDTVTMNFDWGNIIVWHAVDGDRLVLHVTIENTTGNMTFDRYRLFYLALKYPQIPLNTDNIAGFNTDGPTSVFRDYGSGVTDLVNEESDGALGLGYWQVNNPPDDKWFIQLFVDPGQHINPNWPSVVRNIEPFGALKFKTSIRFASAGSTEDVVAADVFQEFRETFPYVIAHPAPRQPVARLSFNGKFNPQILKNPRGWFNDQSNTDVTTPEGIAKFQQGLLGAADSSVAEMMRMNALGGVVWDIEGQQLDQSYIGDPAQAEICAPEIVGVLDEFMRRLSYGGRFQTGFTLRPQTFRLRIGVADVFGTQVVWKQGARFHEYWAGDRTGGAIAFGTGNWRVASVESPTELTLVNDAGSWTDVQFFYAQQVNIDHYEEMRKKVQYGYQRWGATLYYVDSTLGYYGNLTPGEAFEKLRAEYPMCKIFPEWKGTRHYASTWPWTDTQLGYCLPPNQTVWTYPNAAGLIRVPPDEQIDSWEPALTDAVRKGNILLFDGWYPHHANDVVARCYQNA